MTRRHALGLLPLLSLVAVVSAGCGAVSPTAGSCHPDPMIARCGANFVGYSCSGGDRPDEIVNVNKVIDSPICHGTGETLTSGAASYCCTSSTTSCAYDPRAFCNDPSLLGYSCLGTNRPDAYDPALVCQQGLKAYGLITFCCGANVTGGACVRNTNVSCNAGLLGFVCTSSAIPSETDLGQNQSRSEVPLICNLSAPDATAKKADGTPASDYCCYTPSATPPGATCLQDQDVSGCTPGAFAFACSGVDTPEQDYPRMRCPQAPARGVSQTGVNANLYCCSFSQQP